MYGSSFTCVTRRPRASSSAPTDAQASPLPIEETTPPVTNTYLVGLRLIVGPSRSRSCLRRLAYGAGTCEAATTTSHVLCCSSLFVARSSSAGGSWQGRQPQPPAFSGGFEPTRARAGHCNLVLVPQRDQVHLFSLACLDPSVDRAASSGTRDRVSLIEQCVEVGVVHAAAIASGRGHVRTVEEVAKDVGLRHL